MPLNWSNGKNGRKHSLTPGKCRYLSGEQEMWRNLFQKKARAVVGSKLNQKKWKKKVGVKFCKRIFPSVVVDVNYRPALVPLSWKCKKLSQIRKVFQQTSSWKVIQQTVMKMWKISRQGISKQQSGDQWIDTRIQNTMWNPTFKSCRWKCKTWWLRKPICGKTKKMKKWKCLLVIKNWWLWEQSSKK